MKNFYSGFSLLIFCFFTSSLLGQQSIVDSLKALIPQTPEDTHKVRLYGNIAYFNYQAKPDECLEYAQLALDLAEKLKDNKGLIKGHFYRALCLYSKGEYDESLKEAQWSLEKSEELKDQFGVRANLNLMGIIHKFRGNLEKALENSQRMLDLAIEMNDTLDIRDIYRHL